MDKDNGKAGVNDKTRNWQDNNKNYPHNFFIGFFVDFSSGHLAGSELEYGSGYQLEQDKTKTKTKT